MKVLMYDIGPGYDLGHRERLAVELWKLDLNLLVSLDALLQERSVTRAAERLRLSQPSLSAALAKLRRHFGDDLLMRTGNTYQLTPLAVQLKQRTSTALASVDRVFTSQREFDPATCTREFLILASDNGIGVLGHEVATVLRERAPLTRLRLHHHSTDVVDSAPESLRAVDAVILPHGWLLDLPYVDLYTDEWVIIADEANPAISGELTLEHLRDLPWIFTFHAPTAFTAAARQMRIIGIEPRVDVITESFLAVPLLLRGTDRIALMQGRLAERILPGLGVRAYPCPFDASPLIQALWWHPMHDRDPEHELLREVFVEAARRVTSDRPA